MRCSILWAILCLLITSQTASAQLLGGGGIVLGSRDEGQLGINAKLLFPIREKLHLSPGVTFFAPENESKQGSDIKVRFSVVEVDAQFHFNIVDELHLYPLAGLGMAFSRNELTSQGQTDTENTHEFGINIGAGARYQLVDRLHLFGEGKLTIGGMDQTSVTLGVLYSLFD